MTSVSELKKRWMNDPQFQREYLKADQAFTRWEARLTARAAARPTPEAKVKPVRK